ncbi:hypothetical protein [Brevibacillus sp. NRS-1366]|uniref:hypothetical protein n=1 Tax=Brevibacillus sp. NRS-1366 TaxID=3233899 RepID=UPI003D1DE276
MKASSQLRLIAIKTKAKVFISDNIKNDSYYHSSIKNYLFDGEIPKETYRKSWYEVKTVPTKAERKVAPERINERYELKAGYPESELTPKVIYERYIDEDSQYAEVIGLYEKKFELSEETYEELQFEINVIEELDQFEITQQQYDLRFNFLDTLNYHPVLLPTRPCKLTKEESYKIIRDYIKHNIDSRYAYVSSDYDFCFTVKKRIELYKQESYQVDVNQNTRKKPKYETRYRKTRDVTIFEVAPKAYQSYPIVQEFKGENEKDLQNNIDNYLSELINEINRPYTECVHCKGYGVILKEDDNETA